MDKTNCCDVCEYFRPGAKEFPRCELCDWSFDAKFDLLRPKLTWRPWVGCNFASCPANQRLWIVGESHYYKVEKVNMAWHEDMNFTRAIVCEALVNCDWKNRTLDGISELLFQTQDFDRKRFWMNTAYSNFVQTLMDYNEKQRPTYEQWMNGWTAFFKLARIIRPSYCLFIGVEAFNHYTNALEQEGLQGTYTWTDKISGAYGRKASFQLDGAEIHLMGVKHLGTITSPAAWHEHLLKHQPDLMEFLNKGAYC